MPGNGAPIYTRVGDIQWGASALTAANTAKDGTGTVLPIFTADATNGGFVRAVLWWPAGTNIASVGRVFLNNGSTNATALNNIMIAQITLPVTTNSEVNPLTPQVMPINMAIPPGYVLNAVLGTAVAAGYYVTAIGGKY